MLIAEQKFGVDCDSPEMQTIYQLAEAHRVPVLMHWQFGMYNHGFERFHRMLEKYPTRELHRPRADVVGEHRQEPQRPDGALSEGPRDAGRADRSIPARLPEHVRRSLRRLRPERADARRGRSRATSSTRHQDKLLYGSDCNDDDGSGEKCQGAQTIAAIRRLSADKDIERKLLHDNARKLLRL